MIDYILVEKLKKIFLLLAIIVIFCLGCTGGDALMAGIEFNDPEMDEIVNAIESFEQDKGRPPTNLNELIPAYIIAVDVPSSVDSMHYTASNADGVWEINFEIECFGWHTKQGDTSIVITTLLPPEEVLQCQSR